MESIERIKIGENEYTVTMFNPVSAFKYLHDLAEAGRDKRSYESLEWRAIAQCLDPMLRSLGEAKNFDAWFSQYPKDMMLLGQKAMAALTDPFVSNGDDINETETT